MSYPGRSVFAFNQYLTQEGNIELVVPEEVTRMIQKSAEDIVGLREAEGPNKK